MFIRLVLILGAISICVFLWIWLKNSSFLDNFIKDATIDKEHNDPEVDAVIESIKLNKNTLKQKASINKEVAKKAEKEASKIEGYLNK